ncbi:hypothetical protein CsSME_00052402 [Camellia sinensis var. sinensis]
MLLETCFCQLLPKFGNGSSFGSPPWMLLILHAPCEQLFFGVFANFISFHFIFHLVAAAS